MATRNRVAEILYDSEAALRLVASQLGELGRPSAAPAVLPSEDRTGAPDGASDQSPATQAKRP